MIYIILIILHFTFDWILQPRHIAVTKYRNIDSLNQHMLLNVLPFHLLFIVVLFFYDYTPDIMIPIILISYVSHGFIDYFLPKGTTERTKINWTALDQILHLVIMFGLIEYFK